MYIRFLFNIGECIYTGCPGGLPLFGVPLKVILVGGLSNQGFWFIGHIFGVLIKVSRRFVKVQG